MFKLEIELPPEICKWVMEEGDTGAEGHPISLPNSLLQACIEVNKKRTRFRSSEATRESIGNRFKTHPDRHILSRWLIERAPDSDELEVLYWLSRHVMTEWELLPVRTSTQHHKLYRDIELAAHSLGDLIEATGSEYYRGGGHGLRSAFVSDLFTDSEERDILGPLVEAQKASGADVLQNPQYLFPTVEDVLERIAQAANRLAAVGPKHSQPNKRGALTGYFVRRMREFLIQRYGDAPIKILAAVAAIALDVVIDDDLAAKHVSLSERSKRK